MRPLSKDQPNSSICRALIVACAFVALAGGAGRDDWRYWSKFGKGSWTLVRSTTETLDRDGRVTSRSVTDSQTTLVERTDRQITLRVVTTVQVAGKRFETEPTLVVAGPLGESAGEKAVVEPLSNDRIEFEGVTYVCQRRRARIAGRESYRIVEWTSNPRFALAPLRRIETLRGPNDETISTTTANVVAVNAPHKVLGETMPVTYVRTLHKNHKITSTTMAACCSEVPGQVVSAATKELDMEGRVVRRNTVEVVGYQTVEDDRGGLMMRAKQRRDERRARRQQKLDMPSS
jgi:hypothetical protein